VKSTLGVVTVPVMLQGGTKDNGITPSLKNPKGVYDSLLGKKYYIEFDGADHLAWTDAEPAYHKLMAAYVLAFFDRYLERNPVPLLATKSEKQVSDFRAAP
jgi:predicted dienelactone hydrolase